MIPLTKSTLVFYLTIASLLSSAQSLQKVLHQQFSPDSTVNTILRLDNSSSDIWSGVDLVQEGTNRVAFFSNRASTQYLKAIQLPGDAKYQFSLFEIGELWIKDLKEKKLVKLPFDSFQTESGVHLGMSQENLIQLKGKNFIKKTRAGIDYMVYTMTDFSTSSFLKKHNVPEYSAEYGFKKGVLIVFSFGFPYP